MQDNHTPTTDMKTERLNLDRRTTALNYGFSYAPRRPTHNGLNDGPFGGSETDIEAVLDVARRCEEFLLEGFRA